MRGRRALLLALIAPLCLSIAACGNANVVTASDVTQSYVDAIAEGNYPAACSLLEPHTRAAEVASARTHQSCPALLDRCLPNNIKVSAADQSQLFYVTIDLQTSGRKAEGTLSGLPVARAVKRVTLVRQRGRWRLTTPGVAVTRCVHRLHTDHRGSARRASAHG
jgi:hypothetical protein